LLHPRSLPVSLIPSPPFLTACISLPMSFPRQEDRGYSLSREVGLIAPPLSSLGPSSSWKFYRRGKVERTTRLRASPCIMPRHQPANRSRPPSHGMLITSFPNPPIPEPLRAVLTDVLLLLKAGPPLTTKSSGPVRLYVPSSSPLPPHLFLLNFAPHMMGF